MAAEKDWDVFAAEVNAQVLKDEPMSRHTTFRIGGPAERFIVPRDAQALRQTVRFCRAQGVPLLPLGNGSNLLVPDEGIRGAVVHLDEALGGIRLEDDGVTVVCGAGVRLEKVCLFARDHALTGLEFAYGIPGSAGGAAYMNAGAYGGEVRDVLAFVRHLDEKGEPGAFSGGDPAFGYRRSPYTGGKYVITEVAFRLAPGDREQIAARMEELMGRRRAKQPLEMPSAGSVFKRPEGYYAGTLIDQCGLKGLRFGGAMVSVKHAGFIVNAGGATCRDVLELIARIKEEVYRQAGVKLESEVRVCDAGGASCRTV